MISQKIKDVYNDHLAVSRSFHRKPFKIRKKFDGFDKHQDFKHYRFLAGWFEKHEEINIRLFFEATLYFHRDEPFVPIKEFCKSKALTNYVQYTKILTSMDLENPKSLDRCVESYKFIKNFCEENSIKPSSYIKYVGKGCIVPSFFNHIKQNRVCRYSLFPYDDYFKSLNRVYRDIETWSFYMGDGDFSPYFYLKRWETSVNYKKLAYGIFNKVTDLTEQVK